MYYLFLDESGDHGLKNLDPAYPVFVLCGVLSEANEYKVVDQKIKDLKKSIWGDKKVIFHSTDIRRKKKEFVNLIDQATYEQFILGLNDIMSNSNFTVIASCVDKNKFIKVYGRMINNIYSVCLSFVLERTVFYLDDACKNAENKKVQVCIEGRGKKEDASL